MKTYIFLLFTFLSLSMTSFAQEKSTASKGTMQINTSASMEVTPDEVILSYLFNEEAKSFNEASEQLRKRVLETQGFLIEAGVDEEDIKTRNYSVNKKYKYDRGQSTLIGYNGRANLVITMPHDPKRLSKIIENVQRQSPGLEYSLGFQISEELEEKTKLSLFGKAYQKAKNRVEYLNNNFGLGFADGPKEMTFTEQGSHMTPQPILRSQMDMAPMMESMEAKSMPVIHPTEKSILVQLTTVWERS